jgi:replication factor A2
MYGGDEFGGGGGGFGGFGADANAFGGNQFHQSQPTGGGGGGFQVDNTPPDGKVKGKEQQGLIPVTVKQLANAVAKADGEQGFMVDGIELNQVTLVGMIIQTDEQNTSLSFTLDDGTGDMPCKQWMDDGGAGDDTARPQWKEGTLVRIVGQLRTFNVTRHVVVYNIQHVSDYNEYTFHFIEVVHGHLKNTKGPKLPMAGTSVAPGGYMPQNGAQHYGGGGYGGAAPVPQQAQPADLNDTVLEFFQSYATSETGSTVNDCYESMKSRGISFQKIRETVDFLVGEGHLYSTIDDEHFKGT